jgi:hypothetical protein
MKVESKSYRGIDFVCEADLPADQQEALKRSPAYPERIKILINGKIAEGCIYYKDYEHWYDTVYRCKVEHNGEIQEREESVSASLLSNGFSGQIPLSGTISMTLPAGSSK